jgi:hypothetical protein
MAIWVVALMLAPLASTGAASPKRPHSSAFVTRMVESARGLHSAQNLAGGAVARNFRLLGHTDLGATDTNGDVWVHRQFAYVGTWAEPCTGGGLKIIDVSDLRDPRLVGRAAARAGTSAEDVVVRHVSTASFEGDLLGVGIQRCDFEDPSLDEQQFGVEFWDVTDPTHPQKLSALGVVDSFGGVHELDLFQRGRHVYALLATPFTEADFRIVDVTNPRAPVQIVAWSAIEHGLSPGPFFGIGSFGATFAHSARASHDGRRAYVSYWDLGVLTFDISNVRHPRLIGRTHFGRFDDGDAHSVADYSAQGRRFLLQNDEDFDPRSPAKIRYSGHVGVGNESPLAAPLWLEPRHRVEAKVIRARKEGCEASDYPAGAAGKIVVVRTVFREGDPGFDPEVGPNAACPQTQQDTVGAAAGAVAIVHDFISQATSPQFTFAEEEPAEVDLPVLYTKHGTALGMVRAGHAALVAQRPSWGFLRVFDARSGRQVARFDDVPNVHAFPPPEGAWSIHNNEVCGNRTYASWYSNGVVAVDLSPLARDHPGDPRNVGEFVPPPHAPAPGAEFLGNVPNDWGVAVRCQRRPVLFLSDMSSGLWIVRPVGRAAPSRR